MILEKSEPLEDLRNERIGEKLSEPFGRVESLDDVELRLQRIVFDLRHAKSTHDVEFLDTTWRRIIFV